MSYTCDIIVMFGSFGPGEIFFIFLIVLLLFGARRLPEIARAMGKAINEFKKTKDDIMNYSEDEASPKNVTDDSSDKDVPSSKKVDDYKNIDSGKK